MNKYTDDIVYRKHKTNEKKQNEKKTRRRQRQKKIQNKKYAQVILWNEVNRFVQ